MRATVGYRKIDGKWRVAHEHASVPFYMDGGDKQRLTSSRKAAPKQIRESVCRESPPRVSEAASFTADAERTIQCLGSVFALQNSPRPIRFSLIQLQVLVRKDTFLIASLLLRCS